MEYIPNIYRRYELNYADRFVKIADEAIKDVASVKVFFLTFCVGDLSDAKLDC